METSGRQRRGRCSAGGNQRGVEGCDRQHRRPSIAGPPVAAPPPPPSLQVIFTDPYHPAQHNWHTTPQLDGDVAALRADVAARVAASQLKVRLLRVLVVLLLTGKGGAQCVKPEGVRAGARVSTTCRTC